MTTQTLDTQDTTTTQPTMSNRQAEALAHYRAWQEEGMPGGYDKFVASRMWKSDGTNVTDGRAGVYVREALDKVGEQPTGKRGRGPARSRVPLKADSAVAAALATFDATVDQLRGRIERAESLAADFDPAAWVERETERLTDAQKAAAVALKAWKADTDAQTTLAEQERERLAQAAREVATEVADALDSATAEREKLATVLEALNA